MSDDPNISGMKRLLRSAHTCIRVVTHDEPHAKFIAREAALELAKTPLVWTTTGGLRSAVVENHGMVPNTENAAAAMYHVSQLADQPVVIALDLCDHLSDPQAVRATRDAIANFEQLGGHLVLVDHRSDFPDAILDWSTPFVIAPPDDNEIERLLRDAVRRFHRRSPVQIDLKRSVLDAMIANLRGLGRHQIERVVRIALGDDRRLDETDLAVMIAEKREMLSREGLLEFVRTPESLNEVGGLRRLKHWLAIRRHAMADERNAKFDPPRGVLLLGVQGAGKSLCAKAIATAWKRPLLRMDPGALYDRFVGESERRLRESLAQAEAMAPIILWIDEIEKAFASAAARSTDGGLSQRMFGTLLTWMQDHTEPVFLVATANDIEALPPELLRKGRFDEIFFVDAPSAEARSVIATIHLRKRGYDPGRFDLNVIADASDGYTGAEIEQAIVSALYRAHSERSELTTAMVVEQITSSPPLTVTMREKIEALRAWAADRCVPAD